MLAAPSRNLKSRGLTHPTRIAVGDGALCFWAALREYDPTTMEQRCWVQKTANIINKLPKGLHKYTKSASRFLQKAIESNVVPTIVFSIANSTMAHIS